MKTIIQQLKPQPLKVDTARTGLFAGQSRWIWRDEEPITDMCRGGNSTYSWWNLDNTTDIDEQYCPIERPKGAKVECIFDNDERWCWVVRYAERKKK